MQPVLSSGILFAAQRPGAIVRTMSHQEFQLLKPTDVTEPDAYWYFDRMGGDAVIVATEACPGPRAPAITASTGSARRRAAGRSARVTPCSMSWNQRIGFSFKLGDQARLAQSAR